MNRPRVNGAGGSSGRAKESGRSWPRLLAFLGVICVLLVSSAAHAQKRREPFVVLEAPRVRSPWLEQALIRVRAELGAVGFSILEVVSEDAAPPGEAPRWFDAAPAFQARGSLYGALVLVESPGRVSISAYASDRSEPVSQNVDRSSASAEVLAVRAVESLRAVMTQALRIREQETSASVDEREELPRAVARFTDREQPVEEPRVTTKVTEEREPAPDSARTIASPPMNRQTTSGLLLQAGPLVHFGSPATGAGAGLEVRASWVYRWILIGLWAEGAAGPGQIEWTRGAIQTRHVAGGLRIGGLWKWSPSWSSQLGVGAGLVGYEVASGDALLAPSSTDTRSSALRLDASLEYWWLDNAAFSAGAALSFSENAPVLRIDGEEIARLGRPSWSLLTGIVLCF